MDQRRDIDRTLTERHGIVRQLDRLSRHGITVNEVEEVGSALRKAGRRALPPLVRRLWKEKNGDVIARYAYLLDFFDDAAWLDQLIQITLRRRDLEDEGRMALLAAIAGCGVDTTAPPFSRFLGDGGGDLSVSLPRMLDTGEEGVLCFLDDFLCSDGDDRRELICRLPSVDDGRVVPLLETLVAVDDPVVRREAVTALGRIRRPESAELLHRLCSGSDATVRLSAGRSLRRLSFLGITAPERKQHPAPSFHEAWASYRDAAGFGTVWISRWGVDGGIDGLYLHLHDDQGVSAAWGFSGLSVREYETRLTQLQGEDGIVAIPVEYALDLIRNGIFCNREQGSFMPADYYLRHSIFVEEDMSARVCPLHFPGYDPEGLATSARLVAAGPEIFEDDAFAGWYLASGSVYDLAEEWSRLEQSGNRQELAHGVESLVTRFITELCIPESGTISRRLFGNAEMMIRAGRERALVERVLAAAASIAGGQLPLQRHPFLKRLALESMDMAREALAEGYDLRLGTFDDNDTLE